MKIYQVHRIGGDWEDYYDEIVGTFLYEKNAVQQAIDLLKEKKSNIQCAECDANYYEYGSGLKCAEYLPDEQGYCRNSKYIPICQLEEKYEVVELEVEDSNEN